MKIQYESMKMFKKDLHKLQSLDELYYKLVTILSLIYRNGKSHCFCEK